MGKPTLLGILALALVGCGGRYQGANGGTNPPVARRVVAVGAANRLVQFDTNAPAILVSDVTISGLDTGDQVVALDVRPATGVLYGMAGDGTLYTLDALTGAAAKVGDVALGGVAVDIDFNPVVDKLRVSDANGGNVRVDPTTVAVTPDTGFAYDGAGAAFPTGLGYTSAQGGATTLYAFAGYNQLSKIPSPNSGTITFYNTNANLPTDGGVHGLDLSPDDAVAILAVDPVTTQGIVAEGSTLVVVNPATGVGSSIGQTAPGLVLLSVAFSPEVFPI